MSPAPAPTTCRPTVSAGTATYWETNRARFHYLSFQYDRVRRHPLIHHQNHWAGSAPSDGQRAKHSSREHLPCAPVLSIHRAAQVKHAHGEQPFVLAQPRWVAADASACCHWASSSSTAAPRLIPEWPALPRQSRETTHHPELRSHDSLSGPRQHRHWTIRWAWWPRSSRPESHGEN